MDGKISRSLMVPASSVLTNSTFVADVVDRQRNPQKRAAPRQVISDMKWEGETWISSEDLAKKRHRGNTEEGEDALEEDATRPAKPEDPVEEDDDEAGRSKDKDVVPSRMKWVWCKTKKDYVLQERERMPVAGSFFAFSPVPTKQVELLNNILNQDACPIDDNFLRTELVPRLNRTHRVSLRLLDWLVVDYSREKNVAYRIHVPILKREIIVEVHRLYCSLRDRYRRRRFDCFRRRHRIYFDLDGKTYSTTVAQLHFFYMAKMYGFLEYASDNLDSIESHMKKTLTDTADAKLRAKAAHKTYRRKPLVTKAAPRVFVSDTPYKLSFEYDVPSTV